MSISRKINIQSWVYIGFLMIMTLMAFFGMNKILDQAAKRASFTAVILEMQQREIDHVSWLNQLHAFMIEGGGELKMETDPHQCGFGKWYYGEGRKKSAQDHARTCGRSGVGRGAAYPPA